VLCGMPLAPRSSCISTACCSDPFEAVGDALSPHPIDQLVPVAQRQVDRGGIGVGNLPLPFGPLLSGGENGDPDQAQHSSDSHADDEQGRCLCTIESPPAAQKQATQAPRSTRL
jgi:hypothetical protein